jgi:cytochrome b subunit of formate dehydrogenase
MTGKTLRKLVHTLLTFVTLVFVVTGLGISDFRLIERLTLGILTKERSLFIHSNLVEIFTILLLIHIYLKVWPSIRKK